jgi:hypothetical protein
MKKLINFLPILLAFVLVVSSCSKSTPEPTVKEKLQRVWTASSVKWDADQVYAKTGTSSRPGYSQFKLDLSNATAAAMTDFDGNSFSGTWSLSSDDKTLTLSGLSGANGAPTGSGGKIEFSVIGTVSTTAVNLKTVAPQVKATSKIVDLNLVNP